jgi:hypothetical protein
VKASAEVCLTQRRVENLVDTNALGRLEGMRVGEEGGAVERNPVLVGVENDR